MSCQNIQHTHSPTPVKVEKKEGKTIAVYAYFREERLVFLVDEIVSKLFDGYGCVAGYDVIAVVSDEDGLCGFADYYSFFALRVIVSIMDRCTFQVNSGMKKGLLHGVLTRWGRGARCKPTFRP